MIINNSINFKIIFEYKMKSIISTTQNLISNIKKSDINLSEYELELRFGNQYKGKFNPNIGRELFFNIFELVTTDEYKTTENAFINDKYFQTGTIRKIKKVDKLMFDTKNYHFYKNDEQIETIYLQKEKINQYTHEYVRLSFNKENLLQNIADNNLKYERMKYRVSIPYSDIFRFDFTVENGNEYSVEIEILLPNVTDNNLTMELNKLTNFLKPIIDKFENLVFYNLLPPQPHTMCYSDLFVINSNKYAVTDKADGVRAFLRINNRNAELINPKTKEVIRDLGRIDLKNTLIDGEYVKHKFFAFDIMFFDGEDVRYKNLLERLEILTNNIGKIRVGLYLKLKKFYTENIFENSKQILNERFPYNVDGLIYTPIYQEYSDSELPIFKWKKRLTIDVRVYYNRKEDFTYFVYGKKYGRINEWSEQYFEREFVRTKDYRTKQMNRIFNNQEYRDLKTKKIHFGKFKIFNSKIFKTPFLGKQGKPNEHHITKKPLNRNMDIILDKFDIVEYEYRDGEWFPLRKRTFDKDDANAIKTIDSILKVIEEELTIEKIVDFSKKYKYENENIGQMYNIVAQDQTFKRDNWRKFHNYVKRKVINNSSNNCIGGSYLDLACGKGGDLQKYINLGYKNIFAIDSSENELYCKNGYIHRLTNLGFVNKGLYYEKDDVKITVLCGDVSKDIRSGDFLKNKDDMDKLNDLFSRVNKFDCISIMFAIHYMLETEDKMDSFMENISELLKSDGKFIGVYLNIEEKEDYVFKNHGIPFYEIKNNDETIEIKNSVWGETGIKEPKINKETLDNWFDEYDLIEINNESFDIFYEIFKMNEGIVLTEDEKRLGFMNNYFIMVKSPQYINKSIVLNPDAPEFIL